MYHKLETKRLTIRQLRESDRSSYYALLKNRDVIKYCFDPLSDEDISESFETRLAPWNKSSEHWLCLAMFEKNRGAFIGVNGFRVGVISDEAELGYLLLPKYQGKGYATESVNAVIDYARELGFLSVLANVTEGNVASCRVLEKCGLLLTGRESESICINNVLYCNLVYQAKLVMAK